MCAAFTLPLLALLGACEPVSSTVNLSQPEEDDRISALEEQLAELQERQAAIEELQASDALALLQCQAKVDHLQERVGELETQELPDRVGELEPLVDTLIVAVVNLQEQEGA